MSGHSKWSTIKRQKAVTDARRSSVFTKLARLIAVAARAGGKDPAVNFRLRLAIDKAKAANMPNDNIDRAIKSGAGELSGGQTKEIVYEGFGPGGAAIIAQAVTDNPNRTAAEIRSIFQKLGGRLGTQNSVAWMFRLDGVVRLPLDHLAGKNMDEIELGLIDAGAEDIEVDGDRLRVGVAPEKLKTVGRWLDEHGLTGYQAATELRPETTVTLDKKTEQQLYRLLDALDEQPDVTNVYSNDV